jgi:hypothetical protein
MFTESRNWINLLWKILLSLIHLYNYTVSSVPEPKSRCSKLKFKAFQICSRAVPKAFRILFQACSKFDPSIRVIHTICVIRGTLPVTRYSSRVTGTTPKLHQNYTKFGSEWVRNAPIAPWEPLERCNSPPFFSLCTMK